MDSSNNQAEEANLGSDDSESIALEPHQFG